MIYTFKNLNFDINDYQINVDYSKETEEVFSWSAVPLNFDVYHDDRYIMTYKGVGLITNDYGLNYIDGEEFWQFDITELENQYKKECKQEIQKIVDQLKKALKPNE